MAHLLAYDGTADNQRQGRLGRILHDFSKWTIRKMINQLHKKMEPVIEYKKENGWITEHVKIMAAGWKWVVSLDELPINVGIGGFKGTDDKNKIMFQKMGDIVFTQIDEDTHYGIRLLLWLKYIHEHWDKMEQSAEAAHQVMNFGNLYKDLLELTKPLDIDDGHDDVEINFKELNDRSVE